MQAATRLAYRVAVYPGRDRTCCEWLSGILCMVWREEWYAWWPISLSDSDRVLVKEQPAKVPRNAWVAGE